MARPEKEGMDYFSFDTNFKYHPKMKMIIAKYKANGYVIATELLCYLYGHKGYYLIWDEENKLLFANEISFLDTTIELIDEIVLFMVKWGFFSKEKFEKCGILTNKRSQKTYSEIARKRLNSDIKNSYNLLIQEETKEKTELTKEIPETTAQTKLKETKLKESTILFDLFWDGYGKKEGRGKAEKVWDGLDEPDKEKIISILPAYVAWKHEYKWRPMPITFLNQKRWLDEIPENYKAKPKSEIRQSDYYNYSDYVRECRLQDIEPEPEK